MRKIWPNGWYPRKQNHGTAAHFEAYPHMQDAGVYVRYVLGDAAVGVTMNG